ncbi:cation:dicarboxylase symporter family transporter [Clostridium bovifaecis]|uniref:Cation:dicarboxylase symporter family transporter n=1 Tax=Clostridium bovifaecis TaxID=2184719 RepID=A0A6I6F5E9_9CLOT|nr:cation:dicarboxylase symporter family transporter [Clostridium bovifaecis]
MKGENKKIVIGFFGGVTDALVHVILKVMYVAPTAVFPLMSNATRSFGCKVLLLLLKLLAVYRVALLLYTFGIYGSSIKVFSNTSPERFFREIYKAQVVALSTV